MTFKIYLLYIDRVKMTIFYFVGGGHRPKPEKDQDCDWYNISQETEASPSFL